MDGGEVLRVARSDLLNMVVGDYTVGIIQTDTSVTSRYVATVNHKVISFVIGANIIDADIAAGQCTVAERDGVGQGGRSRRGADHRTAVEIVGVGVAGVDATAVKHDVAASRTAHDHAS